MTETQFWGFLENLWRTRGREVMMAGMVDDPDPQVQAASHYIMSHALLPLDCDKISGEILFDMIKLLFEKGLRCRTQEAILMILAHHGSSMALDTLRAYNAIPDKGLEVFAKMALDECEGWNNGSIIKLDFIKDLLL